MGMRTKYGLLLLALAAGTAMAQNRVVDWESAQVHPLELTPDGSRLLAVNTADQRLEVFDVAAADGSLTPLASIPVGLEPVSVRARGNAEAWVVNALSDTISVVDLATLRVTRTLDVGDDPGDVVFAGNPQRAFVSIAEANQVKRYDPADLAAAPAVVALQGRRPRALALSPDGSQVYVAFFESGNATSIVDIPTVSNPAGPYAGQNPPPNSGTTFDPPQLAANGAAPRVAQIVRRNAAGQWLDGNDRNWSNLIGWNVLDHDIAVVATDNLAVSYADRLMTTVMALAVKPDGRVAAVGTEALNQMRFEPKAQSIFLRVRIGSFDPANVAATQVADLNPHLDYTVRSVPPNVREQSLGDPRGIVFHPADGRAFVSGMGSNNVIVTDASGTRSARIDVGQGPTGLALNAGGSRLYVLNRFDATISRIDTAALGELGRTAFFDPTPEAIRQGRPLLYDTHANSGLGQIACASCHVDAKSDFLAWDLGDPQGALKAVNLPCLPGQSCGVWHPMKGPMLTQSLQGIVNAGAMHWRGDRENVSAFSHAFVGLQGRDTEPSAADMSRLQNFLALVAYPPNPHRTADGSLPATLAVTGGNGNPANGRNIFQNQPTLGGGPCTVCHALPLGTRNIVDNPQLPLAPQPMKAVQLRGLWDKVGWSRTSQTNLRGFGFNSDSEFDSLGALLQVGFNFGPPATAAQARRDVEAFLLTFDTETFATVGRQITFNGANNADPALLARLNVYLAQADAGSIALIAHSATRGYVYATQAVMLADRENSPTTPTALRTAATAAEPVTFTVVPGGTQYRMGVDRDGDGYFDRDERDHAAQPDDANSTPTGFCRADFNADHLLDANDLAAFTTAFNAGAVRANYDHSLSANGLPTITTADLTRYQSDYNAGCPMVDRLFVGNFE
jgi:YVTN family beta-propeller protein